jgi:hypothetical protein
MNVGQYIERFRRERKDAAEPYLWESAEIVDDWLNDAIEEACQRAHLIEDGTSAFTSFNVAADALGAQLPGYVLKVLRVVAGGKLLEETSIAELDDKEGVTWETRKGEPRRFVFDQSGYLRLFPIPSETVAVKIRVSRLPMDRLSADLETEEPEIAQQWHVKLLNWVYRCALMKNDAETIDLNKAADFEARFIADFGIRENANVERKHRDKTPPVVQYNSF